MLKRLLLIALVSYGAWHLLSTRQLDPGPGMVAPESPRQVAVGAEAPFSHNGYRITPLAGLSLEARVLATERYYLDRESDLAPIDLALGWGPMSDSGVLSALDISQRNRFFFWRTERLPLPRSEIERHAANMHMVPANEWVASKLKRLRPGQVVALEGLLIRAEAEDGWRWVSSLSREDTGKGACELVWVEDVVVAGPAAI